MQKWEYLEVRVSGPEWSDSFGNYGKLAEIQLRATKWRSAAPFMNELGSGGWELAGVADDESLNSYIMFFKRPKA